MAYNTLPIARREMEMEYNHNIDMYIYWQCHFRVQSDMTFLCSQWYDPFSLPVRCPFYSGMAYLWPMYWSIHIDDQSIFIDDQLIFNDDQYIFIDGQSNVLGEHSIFTDDQSIFTTE